MNKKPIVLLDVDGVMTNHTVEYLEEINELFGKEYTIEDVTSYDYGFLEEEERELMFRRWEFASYDDCSLTDQQQLAIENLRGYCRVVVCSTPFVGHIQSKQRFLLRYFSRDDIVLCGDKTLVGGDILVDDSERNIERFREVGGHGIVFDQPWNQGIDGTRCYNFDDIGILVVDYMLKEGIHDFGL